MNLKMDDNKNVNQKIVKINENLEIIQQKGDSCSEDTEEVKLKVLKNLFFERIFIFSGYTGAYTVF